MTVRKGVRWSTANAYLRPAMKRENLAVVTEALTTRIAFEGARAVGVRYRRGGEAHFARARREVILAAGAINSPQLLKLSGVGPGAELRNFDIDVVADRPGVGENLQDHLEFYFQVASKKPITLYGHVGLFGRGLVGLQWLLRGEGLGATNHFEAGGFIRSRAGMRYPDIQFHFLPIAVSYDGSSLANEHGFQAHVGPMRSKSRGWIRLASPEAADAPKIQFNYMSHPDDWTEMRACVRLTRELFAQAAFDPYRGREIQPGPDCVTDDEIDAFVRQHVESAYHPCGACRMGAADDPLAVVDPQTRVIGVEALRVVDSSIMPEITNGNLNAPTIMMAEKASDMILGRPPFPRLQRALLCRAELGDGAEIDAARLRSNARPECRNLIFLGEFRASLSQSPARARIAARGKERPKCPIPPRPPRAKRAAGAKRGAPPGRSARTSPFPTSHARSR